MILEHENWDRTVAPPFDLTPEDIESLLDEMMNFHKKFEGSFQRREQVELSTCYLQGLISPIERKSMEPIALSILEPHRVRSLQHFVSSGKWDTEHLCDRHKAETSETIADPLGVLSVDSSEFVKKGKESVGVARQYCGRLGKVENCQSGVFLAYTSPQGYALLDRRLFLPKLWFSEEYQDRWKKCRIPVDTEFKTKPQQALELIEEVVKSNLFPARWITCDDLFGRNQEFREAIPKELYYLADIPCDTRVWRQRPQTEMPSYCGKGKRPTKEKLKEGEPKAVKVLDVAKDASLNWEIVKLAEGAKGPIFAKLARTRVIESRDRLPGKECWLFIKCSLDGKNIKYFLSNAPIDMPFEEMCRVCVLRWPIEQCFQEGKSEIGMDHYEHRSWEAWHRHMTFVFIAQLFLLRLRHKFKKNSIVNPGTDNFANESNITDSTI